MKRKAIYPIRKEDLSALPTKVLLARLKRLLQCEDSLEASDQQNDRLEFSNQIQFKNTTLWKTAYDEVKMELNQNL